MKASRVRLAQRIHQLDEFREERLRQELANGHLLLTAALQRQSEIEAALSLAEAARAKAIEASGFNLGRYLLYSETCRAIDDQLGQQSTLTRIAEDQVTEQRDAWAMGKARCETTQRVVDRLAAAKAGHEEQKQRDEALDLWLTHRDANDA